MRDETFPAFEGLESTLLRVVHPGEAVTCGGVVDESAHTHPAAPAALMERELCHDVDVLHDCGAHTAHRHCPTGLHVRTAAVGTHRHWEVREKDEKEKEEEKVKKKKEKNTRKNMVGTFLLNFKCQMGVKLWTKNI